MTLLVHYFSLNYIMFSICCAVCLVFVITTFTSRLGLPFSPLTVSRPGNKLETGLATNTSLRSLACLADKLPARVTCVVLCCVALCCVGQGVDVTFALPRPYIGHETINGKENKNKDIY